MQTETLPDKEINAQKNVLFYRCENNRDWEMSHISSTCEEITGISADLILSNEINFASLIHPDDKKYVWETVQIALKRNVPFQLRYRILHFKGIYKVVFEQGHGIYNRKGKLDNLEGFISDCTPCNEMILEKSKPDNILNLVNYLNKSSERIDLYGKITVREAVIGIYFSQGFSMKEIGKKLSLSNRTIETYLNHLKYKLNCRTKSDIRNILLNTKAAKAIMIRNILEN